MADEASSYPAVAGLDRSVLVVHYRPAADALALRQPRLSLVQDARAERRAARGAGLLLAYSARVARHLAGRARVVPIACAIPAQPLEANDAPVAAMIADWLWPPNVRALGVLLACWPEVRRAVPGARLVLAGRSLDRVGVGSVPGVSLIGEVPSAADALSQASVLAFPCPNSSGPKAKVLEALSYGLPVVTTPAGVEGLVLGPGEGADVGGIKDFGARLAGLLGSPERRAELGRSGRWAIERHHAPVPAARARIDAITGAFGIDAITGAVGTP
jgi:glycosyltransferase involved in cell wall biosynthesis